jgi:hypothetical protein
MDYHGVLTRLEVEATGDIRSTIGFRPVLVVPTHRTHVFAIDGPQPMTLVGEKDRFFRFRE